MTIPPFPRSIAAVAVAVALAIFAVAFSAGARLDNRPLDGDEDDYHAIASELVAHGRFGTAYRFPGYPLLVAGTYAILSPSPASMRIPHALLAALIAGGTVVLGARRGGTAVAGAVAAVLLLVDGYLFAFAGQLLTELLFTALLLLAVLAMTDRDTKNASWRGALAGALLAGSVLVRGQGIFLAAAAGAAALLLRARFSHQWRPFALALAACTAAMVLAWNLWIRAELKHWPGLTTGTGWVLYGAHCPEAYTFASWMGRWVPPAEAPSSDALPLTGDEWRDNRILIRAALASARKQPLAMNVKLVCSKLFHLLYPSPWVTAATPLPWRATAIAVAWLTIAAFLLQFPLRLRPRWDLVSMLYLGLIACALPFYGDKRILFPLFPLVCADAGAVLAYAFRKFGQRARVQQ